MEHGQAQQGEYDHDQIRRTEHDDVDETGGERAELVRDRRPRAVEVRPAEGVDERLAVRRDDGRWGGWEEQLGGGV